VSEGKERGFGSQVLPAIVYIVAIFWLGGARIPGPFVPPQGIPVDKIEHAFAFGLMQVFLWRALRYEFPALSPERQSWAAALLASAFGGILELYQASIPYRSADVWDFVADAIGASITAILVLRWTQPQDGRTSRAASSSRTKP
jgi:VanZ family protein